MREILHSRSLNNAINMLDNNRDVFSITDRMRSLSLNDRSGASTSNQASTSRTPSFTNNLTSTESILERFKRTSNPSKLTREIMEMTKAPFIDILKPITNITKESASYMMALGFRFMPGQCESLVRDIRIPETLASLRNLRDNLGLSLTKGTLNSGPLLKLKGAVSDIVFDKSSLLASRVLVEAITFNEGYFGRFIILVHMGVGCTVWYAFAPGGDGLHLPDQGLFAPLFRPIESYEPFFSCPDLHVQTGFNKMTLVEGNESPITPLTQAFSEEKPFLDIEIPRTTQAVKVGLYLGLAVAILLTFGISPNASGDFIA